MSKIIFICHGNICRSTMAEFVFKDMVKKEGLHNIIIVSAATTTEEIGSDTYPPVKQLLTREGIPFEPRKARLFQGNEYDDFDYIIGMDEENIRDLHRICNGDSEGKIHKLLEFIGEERDIADPWYTRDFEQAYDDISSGCRGLLKCLRGNK